MLLTITVDGLTSSWPVPDQGVANHIIAEFQAVYGHRMIANVTADDAGLVAVFQPMVPDEDYWAQEMEEHQLTLS